MKPGREVRRFTAWQGRRVTALLLLAAFFIHGCAVTTRITEAPDPRIVPPRHPPAILKVHLRDGGLVVLEKWRVASSPAGTPPADTLIGTGTRYDAARRSLGTTPVRIPSTDVVLIETNQTGISLGRTLGAVMLGVGAVIAAVGISIAIACAVDPKCFGSCPTFYVWDGERMSLMAEGFSASIAPSLEATDVDALWRARPTGGTVEIVMRNEALETHVVRSVRLLAVPRGSGRVLQTPEGAYHRVTDLRPPAHARAAEGDVAALLARADGAERTSPADSTDLGARERILLDFGAVSGAGLGLAITHRQSLVMTYLLYQTLAWMGGSAGDHLASLARGDEEWVRMAGGMGRALGPIEVQVREPGGEWRTVGEIDETGPIATDVHLVPLPALPEGSELSLYLARGHWRLDAVELAHVGDAVVPQMLEPVRVVRDSLTGPRADAAALGGAPLVTLPGQSVIYQFVLPEPAERCELFLESRGYYLEWVRQAWLAEEDPGRLVAMLMDPRGALRRMAPDFKRQEAEIERAFWGSRAAHP
jgi:hypothetical protein